MAFFDLLNAPSARKPSYMKGSELPLFVPLKMEKIEPATTVNGLTTKIEAVMGNSEIFFYLSGDYHKTIVGHDGVSNLMGLVDARQNPFCFSIKTRNNNFGVRFLLFDAELVLQCRNKGRLTMNQLPALVRSEIDIDGNDKI
ncbi:Ribosome biogenesis protein bop1-A, partial [Frankliniella fusca]